MKIVSLVLALAVLMVGGCAAEMITCNSEDVEEVCKELLADGATITLDICEWNTTTGEAVDYIFYT